MANKYSKFGPAPRTLSCMQRSYLLSIAFKVTSLTAWAAQLKITPLYTILSSFEVGNTPGVGTFYEFIKRLWDSDDNHLSHHVHPLKSKVKKPETKGTKANSVEKVTVVELLPELENTEIRLDAQPYVSLVKIYKKEFLDISVSKASYVYLSYNFFVPRLIFTFQSALPEFSWHERSRFREFI